MVAASDAVTGAGAAAATKRPSVVSSLRCGRSRHGQQRLVQAGYCRSSRSVGFSLSLETFHSA